MKLLKKSLIAVAISRVLTGQALAAGSYANTCDFWSGMSGRVEKELNPKIGQNCPMKP